MALYDLQQQDVRPFKLSEEFLEPYKTRKPDFGFNGLGEVTYRRTYSRVMPDGKKEEWWQTIRRVIEGVYTMQKKWIISNNLGWDNLKAQKSAKEMYERMFSMKFLPAGRGLWAWGTPITEEKGLYLALNSCAMVTTETIREKLAEPFCFLMDASMLGVGVGFDTKGAGKLTINKPIDDVEIYQITDDREGWVISVEKLINSYFLPNQKTMEFDYSSIRPAGEPIKGFGGISSGSEALKQLHINLRTILDNRVGDKISSQDIVDMMNLIGTCVISGNVRRCLRKGTLVFTSEGAKPIENIVVGDTVFTSKGTTTVTEAVYQGKQELLRINTDAGFIDCTDKHRIAVLDTPQSYVWKHANEITLDDRLVFIKPPIQDKQIEIPNFKYDKPPHSTTCKDIVVPHINEEIAWLFGLFHGDGHVAPNFEQNGFNAYVSIAFNSNEIGTIKKANSIFKKFGISPTISEKKGENCTIIHIQSKQLAWFFSQYKKSKSEIVIPDFITMGSETIRASYLAGLFDADGSNARPLSGVITIYPRFAEQVRSLYTSIGIPTGTRFIRNRPNNWKDIFIITIKGTSARKTFKEKIGKYSEKFISKDNGNRYDATFPKYIMENGGKKVPYGKNITITKYDILFGDERLTPIKVLSIESIGIDETYDLSVLNEQEFILGNGLLVHNTAEIAFGEVDDKEFLNLKNYDLHPERMDYGWTSNNSIFAQLGMSYDDIAERIKDNGEPGLEWLDNARAYSRMIDAPDYKDKKVVGSNPSLRAGTKIITDNGIFPIEALEGKKFKVVNLNGQWSDAECFLSGKDKPLYKVVLSDGIEYYATEEHKWATISSKHNDTFSKKKTSELVKGDKLPVNIVSKKHFGNLGTYSDGFLCGWIYGDGWIIRQKNSGETQVNFTIYEKDGIQGGIKSIIEEKLREIGVHTSLHFREIEETYGWYEFSSKDKKLEEFLSKFGCDNKKNGLPSKIWNDVTKEFTYGFLDGLLSSGATIEKDKRITLTTAPENLVKDIVDLLGSLGIVSNVYKQISRLKGYDKTYSFYNISFQGHYIEDKFTLSNKFKQDMLNKTSEDIVREAPMRYVVSVSKTDLKENVWDITVYDDTHCFSLTNVITGNCGEQSLENMETCLLVESFPNRNENLEDYKRTLKFAYLYAKTVTLAKTHWAETNRVMLRNRRIGLSMSGIAQFITDRGLHELKRWCEEGYKTIRYYDDVYSDWLAIPKSIKVTSVKPSGSVSLLAGATAGIHYPESNFYIRRIRLSKFSDLIEPLRKAGYKIEPAVGQEDSTVVAEFPVSLGKNMRTIKDISMWEQLSLGAFMQKYWSDNQVSQTVTFNPKTEGKDIAHALEYFQYQLKGVSFLPALEYESYPQMPYEAITEEEYNSMMEKITEIDFSGNVEDAIDEKFCNNDVCTIL